MAASDRIERGPDRSGRAILAAAGAMLLAAPACLGTDYFVATNGSYANDGLTVTGAWPTILHALDHAGADDTIRIGTGVFREWIGLTNRVSLVGADTYTPTNPPFERHGCRTVIMPGDTNSPWASLVEVRTNGARLAHLTLDGDADANGRGDARAGVYSFCRPLFVSNCMVRNMDGYGIRYVGSNPAPAEADGDGLMGYFGFNTISNISHPEPDKATAIFMDHAPAICEENDIAHVNGTNAYCGIYVYKCYYTSNMSSCVRIASNRFADCLTAIWANCFGAAGEQIEICGNGITGCVAGIRVTAANGPAVVAGNTVRVAGGSASSNATPARGIWIQGDYDPWGENPARVTDHIVRENAIFCEGGASNETVGIILEYDWSIAGNNGVRAVVTSNSVSGFRLGIFVEGGTNGVTKPHDPLVGVTAAYNHIYGNVDGALTVTGAFASVEASLNRWGTNSYEWPPRGGDEIRGDANVIPPLLGAPGFDSDGDGVDDRHDGDDDNDGVPDWKEAIAGTDATNAASLFDIRRMRLVPPGGVAFDWQSCSGRGYTVWRATNLSVGFVERVTNMVANPPTNTYTEDGAGTAGYFYRVAVTN